MIYNFDIKTLNLHKIWINTNGKQGKMAIIKNKQFDGCELKGTDISCFVVENCSFNNCVFSNSTIKNAILTNCRFQNCTIKNCDCSGTKINNSNFYGSTITKNLLIESKFISCTFSFTDFIENLTHKLKMIDTKADTFSRNFITQFSNKMFVHMNINLIFMMKYFADMNTNKGDEDFETNFIS